MKTKPPQIILWSQEFNINEPVEAPIPPLWVVAGDKDGPEDIVTAVLNISSIKLNKLIVRPDDSTQECSRPFYADMDTINVKPYLKTDTFSVNQTILIQEGQKFNASLTFSLLTGGGLEKDGDVFGQSVKPCRWGTDYLYMVEHFGLYPPALSAPRDVYVTYAEFLLKGITITVYDQAGASATHKFPDFYCYFTNPLEKQTLP